MLHDPLANLVCVDAVSERNRRNRGARGAAFLDDLELILARKSPATGTIDANAKGRVRFGIRYLHGGHHLRNVLRAAQERADRTLTIEMRRRFLKHALVLAATTSFPPLAFGTLPYPAANRNQVLGTWVAFVHPVYYFLELAEDGNGVFATSNLYGPSKLYRVLGWKLDGTSVHLPFTAMDAVSEKYPWQAVGFASNAYQGRLIVTIVETPVDLARRGHHA